MRPVSLLAWLGLALLQSTAGLAQDAREPKAGDRFVYTLGPVNDTHEIVAVSEAEIAVKSTVFGNIKVPRSVSGPWSWSGGRNAIRYEERVFGAVPSVMPPEIGKTVSVSGTGQSGRSDFHFVKKCAVLERTRLAVPAGGFDVFTIRCDVRILGGENSYRVYHYAPALGYWASWQTSAQAKLIEFKLAD